MVNVSSDDAEVASRLLGALEAAARSGDRGPVYLLLAPDVEWVLPEGEIHGVDELRGKHTWWTPPEHFDLEFEETDWLDLGDGRVASELREIYLWKETGEAAHERKRRIEVTIRDGKISRYEMRIVA
jgi:ketosteroid isomerase-like protein